MGRIVILEGPDGGGKTTLARQLVEQYGFYYKHEGPPAPYRDNIAYYLSILNEAIEALYNTVFDRCWLGEMIYGPIFRGIDTIGEKGLKLFLRLHNSKYIYQYIVWPNKETLLVNYREKMNDSTDYVKGVENLNKVIELYEKTPFKTYNYEVNKVEDIIYDLRNDKSTLPIGTIGSTSAKYLFIGDKPNHHTIDVPFFAITNSSGYFNEALELAKIKECDLALSNAYSLSGKPHSLSIIIDKLPKLETIFLMGNIAKEWYYSQHKEFPCVNINHPSYLRRFHGHNPQIMADIIKESLNG